MDNTISSLDELKALAQEQLRNSISASFGQQLSNEMNLSNSFLQSSSHELQESGIDSSTPEGRAMLEEKRKIHESAMKVINDLQEKMVAHFSKAQELSKFVYAH